MMKAKDLRIVFMGTPEFAATSLRRLVAEGYTIVAVVTTPDKPAGRGLKIQKSDVKVVAEELNLPILQPEKLRDEAFLAALKDLNVDLGIVIAFRMLPEVVWDMPRYGTFNVHAALLPNYRGAAPINWAVINGETQTGVTTFFLDHDIDTGRVIMQEPFDIHDDYNVEDVYDGLMRLGASVALKTIDRIIEGGGYVESMPQEEMIEPNATLHHAPKIFKDTCAIDFSRTAQQIRNHVRGLSPYPAAWINELPASHPLGDVLKGAKVYKVAVTALAEPQGPLSGPCGEVYSDV